MPCESYEIIRVWKPAQYLVIFLLWISILHVVVSNVDEGKGEGKQSNSLFLEI